jgi:hypothetical protein
MAISGGKKPKKRLEKPAAVAVFLNVNTKRRL